MFQLRQNADDPCLLEQSFDGGETWAIAFNYKLCQNTDTIGITNTWNISNEFNIEQITTYDNDIINIYPDWEYDATPDDSDRDAALCAAVTQWVASICEFMIVSIENGNAEAEDDMQFFSDIAYGLGAAGLALAAFGIYPVAGLFAGTSLVLTGLIIENMGDWVTDDPDPYRSVEARAEVVCKMYLALMGLTPTYANWDGALDDAMSGDAEIIRDVVNDLNHEETAFVDWMGLFADMIAVGAGEVGNECNECEEFLHVWEINELSGVEEHTTYNNDEPSWDIEAGQYEAEVGITAENLGTSPCRRYSQIIIEWDGSRELNRVRFDYDWEEGQIENWGDTGAKILMNDGDVQAWTFAQVQGNTNKQWEGTRKGITKIEIRLFCSNNTPPPACTFGGEATIERVAIEGVGSCPFD